MKNERELFQLFAEARLKRATDRTNKNGTKIYNSIITDTFSQNQLSFKINFFNSPSFNFIKGQVIFVDLVGSEKTGESGASGIQFDEAKAINNSLYFLSHVIGGLRNPTAVRPDFQRCELTRYIQPIFETKFKIVWLAHVTWEANKLRFAGFKPG